jgi:hypothetical protein
MKRSLPLGPAVGSALTFVPRAWVNAWGALVLMAGVLAAPAWLPELDPGLRPWIRGLVPLLALLVGLMTDGALYRLGTAPTAAEARRNGLGLGGLQFGRPELRLLGAGVVAGLFIALVAAGLALVLIFIANATGFVFAPVEYRCCHGGRPGWGPAILLLLALWVLAQLAVRLSLYKAATVGRGRMVSLDSLSLAQGAFLPLLAGLILVSLPTAALMAWEHGLFGAGFVMPFGSTAYAALRAAFLSLVQIPLAAGFLSYVYNKLEYG